MAHGAYKPIEAYGLIGNLETCALVGQDGAIDWCCLPYLQSPSVFAAILDSEKGGTFRIQPTGSFDAVQRYQSNTNVLNTTFTTGAGTLRLTDFMPILSEDPVAPFSEPWIFRRVEAVEGPVAFEVTFEPRFDYARARTIIESMDDVLLARGSGEHVSLNTASPLDIVDKTASGIHELDAGETAWYTLQYGQHKRPESIDPERLLERTRRDAQLGLPVQLDPRRRVHHSGAVQTRPHPGDERLLRLVSGRHPQRVRDVPAVPAAVRAPGGDPADRGDARSP
ncbi:hypothetical protein BRD19_11290 [Halobacteriales archaeon SW_7_65_23]|nr:MAG: hypothetical protein BRD19_11290 [Halobacteriales archaeon SW_7_65_23]